MENTNQTQVTTEQQLPNPTHDSQTQTPAQVPTQMASPVPTPPAPKSKFPKKLIFIAIAVFLLLGVLGIVLMIIFRGNGGVTGILPIPMTSPSPTATATAAPSSPYANDPAVLKIEEDLGTLDGKLNSTDLREDTLRVPVLEWDVKF